MRVNTHVAQHGTVKDNLSSPSIVTIELEEGKLMISDKNLKMYESMTIGPMKTDRTDSN